MERLLTQFLTVHYSSIPHYLLCPSLIISHQTKDHSSPLISSLTHHNSPLPSLIVYSSPLITLLHHSSYLRLLTPSLTIHLIPHVSHFQESSFINTHYTSLHHHNTPNIPKHPFKPQLLLLTLYRNPPP